MAFTIIYKADDAIQSWPSFVEQNKLKFLMLEYDLEEMNLIEFKMHQELKGEFQYKYLALKFIHCGQELDVEIGEGEMAEICRTGEEFLSIINTEIRVRQEYEHLFTYFSEYLNQTFHLGMEND